MLTHYFRARFLVTVATVAFVALTVGLGNWQLRRADEKRSRIALVAARQQGPAVDVNAVNVPGLQPPDSATPAGGSKTPPDLAWRKVRARGVYLAPSEILIDNRMHDHVPGYHVLAPLEVAGTGRIVLVNRGWMPARPDYRAVSPPALPAGEVTVEGIAAPVERSVFHFRTPPAAAPAGQPIWASFDVDDYRRATGLAVLPLVVEQTSDAGDGLIRDWPPPRDDVPMHQAYAVQWFSFAAIAAALYVGLNLKRRRALRSTRTAHG